MRAYRSVGLLIWLLASVLHAQSTAPATGVAAAIEFRGIWLASGDLARPRAELAGWLDRLAAANFNAVLIDTCYRGVVAYPGSAILPHDPKLNGEDTLGWLIDQCHQRGLRAHLWMEYGFYSYFTTDAKKDPSMGAILDEHPDLLSISADGDKFIHRDFGDYYSLCPSNPRSHEILSRIYAEAVRKYPSADGVNLDRIRYAASDYCYCDFCAEKFRKDTGLELRKFIPGTDGARKFLQWKRRQTVQAVRTIVHAIDAARPGIPITSYVVGPEEMDERAQGWDLWMQEGLLDAVAVSMYGPDIEAAAQKSIALLGDSREKLICAISSEHPIDAYLRNIQLSRNLGAVGQSTWHFGQVLDDLDRLKAGPYATPAAARR
jgi:uncharacterized lipoprotein YddW (UPF0748 family)